MASQKLGRSRVSHPPTDPVADLYAFRARKAAEDAVKGKSLRLVSGQLVDEALVTDLVPGEGQDDDRRSCAMCIFQDECAGGDECRYRAR